MAKLSQLTIPVKNASTGEVTSQTFDLAGSGGGSDTNYIGTKAAYDALPSSEKEQYDSMDFTDYHDGLIIDPTPMMNSKNPVASGGVYAQGQVLSNEITDAVELVAPLEPALVATRNYTVGKQFVYNGFLYKVTAPIALDEDIVIGTNCTLAPCVTEQINELADQIIQNSNTYIGDTITVSVTADKTGWTEPNNITNVISPTPTKSGYTLVGFLCRSSTYRIINPYAKAQSSEWQVHFYAQTTITNSVFATPIFKRN